MFDTALPEPAAKTIKETAPSFMERVMAAHRVNKANQDVTGTVVEDDSEATDYKLQSPAKSVDMPPCYRRSKIEWALADIPCGDEN